MSLGLQLTIYNGYDGDNEDRDESIETEANRIRRNAADGNRPVYDNQVTNVGFRRLFYQPEAPASALKKPGLPFGPAPATPDARAGGFPKPIL